MPNTLYIFSTTFNPDVYINAIVHYLNNEAPERVTVEVITVFEDSVEKNKLENKYKATADKIETVLHNLGKGEYHTTDTHKSNRLVQLEEDDRTFYERSKSKINGRILSRSILYTELEKEISEIIHKPKDKLIFDLSGERKYLLVDILFISLANNFKELYVFDILRPPDFDFQERNLIHNLSRNEYKFRNLLHSKYVNDSLERISQAKDIEIANTRNMAVQIINFSSDKFAKMILFVLFVLIVILLVWFLRYRNIIKNNWNEIEPSDSASKYFNPIFIAWAPIGKTSPISPLWLLRYPGIGFYF